MSAQACRFRFQPIRIFLALAALLLALPVWGAVPTYPAYPVQISTKGVGFLPNFHPSGLAVAGKQLAVSDLENTCVYVMADVSGHVTSTIKDVDFQGFTATVTQPEGVVLGPLGLSAFLDAGPSYLVAQDSSIPTQYDDIVHLPAGPGGTTLTLNLPTGLAYGPNGTFIVDTGNNRVLQIDTGFTLTTVVDSSLSAPTWVAADSDGTVYVSDTGNGRVLKETWNRSSYDPSLFATLANPQGLAVDAAHNVYIADPDNMRIIVQRSGQATPLCYYSVAPLTPLDLALDGLGRLYFTATGFADPNPNNSPNDLFRINAFGENVTDFGQVPVGSHAKPLAYFVNYPPPDPGQPSDLAIGFLAPGGGTSPDFAPAPSELVGNAYDQTQAVATVFSPTLPGLRTARMVVKDTLDHLIASIPLSGIGTGPQLAFLPAAAAPLSTGLSYGPGVAVDAASRTYVIDQANNQVLRVQAGGGGTPSPVATGLTDPVGVAVDGQDTVYIAEGSPGQVLVVAPSGGGYAPPVTPFTALATPISAIAVDPQGNVYVATAHNGTTSVLQGFPGLGQFAPVGSFTGACTGLAVGQGGRIYCAIPGSGGTVYALDPAGAATNPDLLNGNPADVQGVATDAFGNVYFSDGTTGTLNLLALNPGHPASRVVLAGGLEGPRGLAVDGAGNLVHVEPAAHQVYRLELAGPPSLNFPETLPGAQATGSFTVINLGNAPLDIQAPASGTNPALSGAGFQLAGGDFPIAFAGGSDASLAPNGVGTLLVTFDTPAAAGSYQGSITLNDNNLGTPGTQTLNLQGTSLGFVGVELSNLDQVFTGSPLPVTVTTFPSGLPVTVTYTVNGQATPDAPSAVGSYPVSAVISDGVHSGADYGTLVISPAWAPPVALQGVFAQGSVIPPGLIPPGMEPRGIAVNYNGANLGSQYLYITDAGNNALYRFNLDPQVILPLSTLATGLNQPEGVTDGIGTGQVFADSGNNQLKEYVGSQPAAPFATPPLYHPSGVACQYPGTANATLVVADTYDQRVLLVDPNNPDTITPLGPGWAQPTGVAVDPANNIYVADAGLGSRDGQVVMFPAADLYHTNPITVAGGLASPAGVAADASGTVYIPDAAGHAIQLAVPAPGGYLTQSPYFVPPPGGYLPLPPYSVGSFSPHGLALDGSGTLYFTDQNFEFVMKVPTARVTLDPASLSQACTGAELAVTASTTPAGLPVAITYYIGGIPRSTPPSAAGSYTVTAMVNDGAHMGAVAGTLVIYPVAAPPVQVTAPPAPVTPALGFPSGFVPGGIAVDYAGAQPAGTSLFITDNVNGALYRLQLDTLALTVPATGLHLPEGVTDSNGLVFADTGAGQVDSFVQGHPLASLFAVAQPAGVAYQYPGTAHAALLVSASGGVALVGGAHPGPLGSSWTSPAGVAVDGANNVYVADAGTGHLDGRVLMFRASDISAANLSSPVPVATGLDSPYGVAADAVGNVYVADGTGRQILVETPVAGGGYAQSALPVAPYQPRDLALDGRGSLYFTDPDQGMILKLKLAANQAAGFGAVQVGQSAVMTLAVSLDPGITLSSTAATRPQNNAEFTIVGGAVPAHGPLDLQVQFSPAAPGFRTGALVLKDSAGHPAATIYLSGTGLAPQAAFRPGNPSQVTTTTAISNLATAVAVDWDDNTYLVDQGTGHNDGQVLKVPRAGGSATVVAGGLANPVAVAVDPAENVYIADAGSGQVLMEAPGSGSTYSQTLQSPLAQGLSHLTAVAADAEGNVYYADQKSGIPELVKLPLAAGYVPSTVDTFIDCAQMAVDAGGAIFVADPVNQALYRETPGPGASFVRQTLDILPNGPPQGVALDGRGQVYVSDGFFGDIYVETFGPDGTLTGRNPLPALGAIMPGVQPQPYGLATDRMGNLAFAGFFGSSTSVYKLDFGTTPPLFPTVGSLQAEYLALENVGNAPLILGVPVQPTDSAGNPVTNPQLPATDWGFHLGYGTGSIPQLVTGDLPAALAPGASWQVPVLYYKDPGSTVPVAGTNNISVQVIDNSLNAFTTQTIQVFGDAGIGTPANPIVYKIPGVAPGQTGNVKLGGLLHRATLRPQAAGISPQITANQLARTSGITKVITTGLSSTGITADTTGNLTIDNVAQGIYTPITITVLDAAGNTNTQTFTLDATGTTAPVTITLQDSVTYNGKPQTPAVTTIPPGLEPLVSFDFSPLAGNPINVQAGGYPYKASIDVGGWTGLATGTLQINPAPVALGLTPLQMAFTGQALAPTAIVSPATVAHTVTLNPGDDNINVGSCSYTLLVTDPNYTAPPLTRSLKIIPATVTIQPVGDLTRIDNGSPQTVVPTFTPQFPAQRGPTITVRYDGSTTAPTDPKSDGTAYQLSASIDATPSNANFTPVGPVSIGTLTINQVLATVPDLGTLHLPYTGAAQSVQAPVAGTTLSPPPVVQLTYLANGVATTPIDAGSYTIAASITDPRFTRITNQAIGTLIIDPAPVTLAWSATTFTYDGTAHAVTASVVLPGSVTVSPQHPAPTATVSYSPGPGAPASFTAGANPPTGAGTYNLLATLAGGNGDFTLDPGLAANQEVIKKASVTINPMPALTLTYNGGGQSLPNPGVNPLLSPPLIPVLTYNGSSEQPIDASQTPYQVVASLVDPNYMATPVSSTLTINPAPVTLTWSATAFTYDGTAHPVTASVVVPPGVTLTPQRPAPTATVGYTPGPGAPTNAGSYGLLATLVDGTGDFSLAANLAVNTELINKATSAVNLSNLTQTYTGSMLMPTAGTTPPGAHIGFSFTPGGATAPTNAGFYGVTATIQDPNYFTASASGTFHITRAPDTLALDPASLAQTYNGSPRPVSCTVSPASVKVTVYYLVGFSLTTTAPVHPGSYPVFAVVTDPNYAVQTASGTLVISKATATVTLGNLSQSHIRVTPVTVTTVPAGLAVRVTYNGSTSEPRKMGSYTVVATVNDTNYQGSATGTLTIY